MITSVIKINLKEKGAQQPHQVIESLTTDAPGYTSIISVVELVWV